MYEYVLDVKGSNLLYVYCLTLCVPDPLQTYLSLCGLSLLGCPGVTPLNIPLSISIKASQHLTKVRSTRGVSLTVDQNT